jgi:hypothetical protein
MGAAAVFDTAAATPPIKKSTTKPVQVKLDKDSKIFISQQLLTWKSKNGLLSLDDITFNHLD